MIAIFLVTLLFLASAMGTQDQSESDNTTHSDGRVEVAPVAYQFPVFPTVELTRRNHIVLKGEINEEMISKAIVNINNIEEDEDQIMMYIISPGGSVIAGNNFIQFMSFMRLKGKTFTCVADQAASMAFAIFQECDNRYVTPTSIIMQHQMSVGLQDQYENLKNRIHLLDAINQQAITRQSARIGLSIEEFKKKVVSDWWLYGEESVKENASDKVVYVGCSHELLKGTYEETVEFLGTTFKIVFSKCPLARAPISFSEEKPRHGGRHVHEDNQVDLTKAFQEFLRTEFLNKTTIRHYL
jgi:ATP-dependent Clp protease, protease subunit